MILCEAKYQDVIVNYPLLFQKMVQDYLHTSQDFLNDIVVVHSSDKDSVRFFYPKKSGFNGADFLLDQINSRWHLDPDNHEFDVLVKVDNQSLKVDNVLELRFKPNKTRKQNGF